MPIETARSRILTLDLLRGYFLFVIIIDHMGFFPSAFELFTGRGEMWASAAEGFFIISGMLVGYIYGPRMVKDAMAATKKIWKRAFLLYALTVVLTFLFVWWGNHSDIAHVKEGLWTQPPIWEFLYKTLTMQYYYGWADFLPYYAIFMVWAPFALYLCVKRLGWLVLLVSGVCWLARGNSFEMAWQILFMGSMVAGWYLPQIEAKIRSLPARYKRWFTTGLYSAAFVLLTLSVLTIRVAEYEVHNFAGFGQLPQFLRGVLTLLDNFRDFMTPYIVKWTLEPARLVTAVVWFAALYVFVRQREDRINRLTHSFFKALGERSLVVYVIHAVVIFTLMLVANGSRGFLANTLMSTIIIGFIYTAAIQWTALTRDGKQKTATSRSQLRIKSEEAT